jgi:signal transduction histidine kinase
LLHRFYSLRVRLLLLATAVLAVALGAVALFSVRVVSVQLRAYIESRGPRPEDLGALGAELAAYRQRTGGWTGAHAILASAGRRMERELLVLGPDGRFVAATSPDETYGPVHVGEGGRRLSWVRRSPRGSGELELVGPYHLALSADDGTPLGTLFVTPATPQGGLGEMGVVGRINRALLLAALAAGTAGLLLSFALGRRILKPVEALTLAARRMEAGDLGQRVEVAGRDEIAELAQAFNAMAERRATAERLRRDLVSDVAHELRSPLTNLRCQIEALQDGLAPASPEVFDSLHEEARLLETLIDDLQDLALAEAGQLELELGPLDLGREVERAVKAFRPLAEARELRIETELPPDLPAVDADARRLAQILRNLLGNAVTHTPSGGLVRVTAAGNEGDAGEEVEVRVADSGPGIPAAHLPFLFERFYRTDASRSRETGGAGLGLAIVKQLAAAHGGRVWVESAEGRGSVFGFSLPAARN